MKPLFRSATAYRLVNPEITFDNLEDHPVQELAPGQTKRVGWHCPNDGELPWLDFTSFGDQKYTLLCMAVIEKRLKASAVNRELAKKIKAIQAEENRIIYRKERLELKEDNIAAALPNALPEESRIHAYFDWSNNLLIIDQHSVNKCELFLNSLREALGSLQIVPLHSKNRPEHAMKNWLTDDTNPPHVEIQGDAEFKNPVDLSQTAKVKHVAIDSEAMTGILSDGMIPQELSLTWKLSDTSTIDFRLTDTVQMKSIKFSDDLLDLGQDYEDSESEFIAAMLINCGTITRVLLECFGLFGGLGE